MFCVNCGEKIADVAKFCPKCGKPIARPNNATDSSNNSQPVSIKMSCKDCGGTLEIDSSRRILVCPFCQSKEIIIDSDNVQMQRIQSTAYKDVEMYRINAQRDIELKKLKLQSQASKDLARDDNSAIRELVKNLIDIDNEKQGFFNTIISGGTNSIRLERTKRKIALVKSVIIPNTLKSVSEFVHLAESHINIELSKNRIGHNWAKMKFKDDNPEQTLSDAWVSKMMFVYKRGSESFGNLPEFEEIQKTYNKLMKALKIK